MTEQSDDQTNELTNLLTDLGLSEEKAKEAANIQTLAEFEKKFQRLEGIVSSDVAYNVVEKGEFAFYKNGKLEAYFTVASQVTEKIKPSIAEPEWPQNELSHLFYSTNALEQFMKTGELPVETILEVPLGKYRLLHPTDPQARDYLSSLIEKGTLQVGDCEHWSKKDNHGLRGQNILKELKKELDHMFGEAKLPNSSVRINHGQKTISVDEATQTQLRIFRDKAYRDRT